MLSGVAAAGCAVFRSHASFRLVLNVVAPDFYVFRVDDLVSKKLSRNTVASQACATKDYEEERGKIIHIRMFFSFVSEHERSESKKILNQRLFAGIQYVCELNE